MYFLSAMPNQFQDLAHPSPFDDLKCVSLSFPNPHWKRKRTTTPPEKGRNKSNTVTSKLTRTERCNPLIMFYPKFTAGYFI